MLAIDPGALRAEVASRANVTHLPWILSDGGECIDAVRQALMPAEQAGCVVCDANIPATDAGRLIAALAARDLLAVGCVVILTLKAPNRVRNGQGDAFRREQEAAALAALAGGCEGGGGDGGATGSGRFEQVRTRHLFANTQHEATLTAVYAVGDGGAGDMRVRHTFLE